MDITELIAAFPNLAFGLVVFWFFQQVQKERVAENARYAASLEKINDLYMQLLERAVAAIANNASQSASNGDILDKLRGDIASLRSDMAGLRDAIARVVNGDKADR